MIVGGSYLCLFLLQFHAAGVEHVTERFCAAGFPYWPTQSWFPLISDLLVDFPVLLPESVHLLPYPVRPELVYTILPAMRLVAGLLSPDGCRKRSFHQKLSVSSQPAGSSRLPATTPVSSSSGSVHPYNPSFPSLLSFLTFLYDKGVGFSQINTARSATCTCISAIFRYLALVWVTMFLSHPSCGVSVIYVALNRSILSFGTFLVFYV